VTYDIVCGKNPDEKPRFYQKPENKEKHNETVKKYYEARLAAPAARRGGF
jgi:hypothetical protein